MNATALMNPSVFTSFEQPTGNKTRAERLVSFLTAGVLVVSLGAALWNGAAPRPRPAEKPVEVTFVPEPVVEAAPPPPAKPRAAAAAAPVVPKHLKKVIVDTPSPAKPLEAPTEAPQGPLAEADPSLDKGIMVAGGDAVGDPAGLEGGSAQGKAGGVVGGDEKAPVSVAVEVPENAVPPKPFDDNAIPEYPAAAKAAGQTGMVILKVIIDEQGNVVEVKRMRGDEPFLTAAITAVKTWRYQPASQGGKPLRVFRLVKIPFQLNQ